MYVGYDRRWPKGFNEFLTSAFNNVRDQVYSVVRNDLSDIRISSWARLAIRKAHLSGI